jgi:hypothetical protein
MALCSLAFVLLVMTLLFTPAAGGRSPRPPVTCRIMRRRPPPGWTTHANLCLAEAKAAACNCKVPRLAENAQHHGC